MIDKTEILEFSKKLNLSPEIIEKDYVIGWILAGINNHIATMSNWKFKGGTCLKKCFFETYRFSEDLDFTLIDSFQIDEQYLTKIFIQIVEWIYEESGVEIPKESIEFKIYENLRGSPSAQGKVGYIGPLQKQRGGLPKVKLDLTKDEVVVLETRQRDVYHPYSDRPQEGIQVNCYLFEELFAEKIRALAERARPRDLYDVIHLYRNRNLLKKRSLLFSILNKKCLFKGIETPTYKIIETHEKRDELKSEWENMLQHQLPNLLPLKHYWKELPLFFHWLHGEKEEIALPIIKLDAGSRSWTPGRFAGISGTSYEIEQIQFAAANRVCIRLVYNNKSRTIEPYSFRQSRDSAKLFYGYERKSHQIKCFRLDRFQSLSVTAIPYTAKYKVEISSSGYIRMPQVSSHSKSVKTSNYRTRKSSGPTYIYECSFCGRQFQRKKRNSQLKPHKDKHGYPCSGRRGIFLRIKY